MKLKLTTTSVWTILFPLLIALGTILLILLFVAVPDLRPVNVELEVNITDGRFDLTEQVAYFNNQRINVPEEPLALPRFLDGRVLSAVDEEVREERWIEIDLGKQRLYAHEGDMVIYEFPISSGKWGATPAGEFRVWAKLKYTLMHGGSRHDNTYYYLPNVPYTQYFHSGYGLHGTYWHNNFGHPMSHGCINMYTPDAETIFYWTSPVVPEDKWVFYPTKTSPGTRVVIHGFAPRE